ncbi:MAG: Cdc6/Cdc18 family protein [Candidatus Bathyarchaeia archaeon]
MTDALEVFLDTYLQSGSLFTNRVALRDDFVPNHLPHREREVLELGSTLAPLLRGEASSNVLLYGTTGTGKTAAAVYVTQRLISVASNSGRRFSSCHVNCTSAGTAYRVAAHLCSAVGLDVPFTGLATADLVERFRVALDERRLALVVTLDEVDTLVGGYGDELLYGLTRMNDALTRSRLVLLGISNDAHVKGRLGARVLSGLREEELLFKPYSAEQLLDILTARATVAFGATCVAPGALRLCAALAAAEHGDARKALNLLRVAGELADRGGSRCVEEGHIKHAAQRIDHDRTVETLTSLPLHQRLIVSAAYLQASRSGGTTCSGELYTGYRTLCARSGVSPLTSRRVGMLLEELATAGVISAEVVSLGRHGRTKRIRVGVNPDLLHAVATDEAALWVLPNAG